MPTTKTKSGVTFAVDDVEPAAGPRAECRTHEALLTCLGGVESCHDYHGTVVKNIRYHPLLAAVYTAFNEHRPLVLSPDAVWVTIAQGIAHHMAIHGEGLRSRFVAHQGKLDLVFECSGWVEGSPENPWLEAFSAWAGQIRDHVGSDLHDSLVCDFSTSGPTERAASQIVMMDIFERYFHYTVYGVCGIPSLTLEGSSEDWRHLSEKVARLRLFDIDWWLDHLQPICQQFARASQGDIDLAHWQGICKLRQEYGGHVINGWVAKLFPYLRAFINGPCNRRNPIFDTGEGFKLFSAPSGLSRVPFRWVNRLSGSERQMEAVGGLVGISQDPQTLALRPQVGWAVRQADKLDVALARLGKDHHTCPGIKLGRADHLPPDLCKFFHHTDGASLFGPEKSAAIRLLPYGDMAPLAWGENPETMKRYGARGHNWHQFATMPDGSFLAIHLKGGIRDPRMKEQSTWEYDPNFSPICHGRPSTQNCPGQNPVIAFSFTELLERLLDSHGQPYWLSPDFHSYGDAEQFTRRD